MDSARPSAPPLPHDFHDLQSDAQRARFPSLPLVQSYAENLAQGAPDSASHTHQRSNTLFSGYPHIPQRFSRQLSNTPRPQSLSAQDSLQLQRPASQEGASSSVSTDARRMLSLSSYVVRPQELPHCCCSRSLPKVTGQDRYPPQLQDRQQPSSICTPEPGELNRLPGAQDPAGRHVIRPYHQAWRFRGIYSFLLVAVLLGTGIAYLIVRHM